MLGSSRMTSEPSTSAESLCPEKSFHLQETSSQTGIIRQKKCVVPSTIRNSIRSPAHKTISLHPLIPIVRLLYKKCENAAINFDRESFEMDDVKKLFKSLEESGVQLNAEKTETDIFMETAVLTLRQCMVEIERVFVLSECFKTKYLAVLRKSVCQEALVGNSGDSDDEQPESSIMPSIRLPESLQEQSMGSTLASLQNAGTLPFGLSFAQPPFTMMPTPQQLEQNLEILRQCGILAANMPSSIEDAIRTIRNLQHMKEQKRPFAKTPDKSEEEKTRNRSDSKTPDDI